MVFAMILGLYWIIPYLLISPILGEAHIGADWMGLVGSIALHTLGKEELLSAAEYSLVFLFSIESEPSEVKSVSIFYM